MLLENLSKTLSAYEVRFISAAESGNLENLRSSFEAVSNVNLVDRLGETALIKASKLNHPDNTLCVAFLLENDADYTLTANNGWGAIHYATYYGCSDVVNLLLTKDPSLANFACELGRRPIHMAAMNGHVEIIRALVIAGANVSAVAIDGNGVERTALDFAELNNPRVRDEILTMLRGAMAAAHELATEPATENRGLSHASASQLSSSRRYASLDRK